MNLKAIKPLHWNPAVFFRRARLIAGGQIVEDIDSFNRLSLMLTTCRSEDVQLDIANEGFCSFDNKNDKIGDVTNNADADERKRYRESDFNEAGVVATSRRVSFKPLLGLFNQEKLLPLRDCPIQIELELVNSGDDAVFAGSLGGFTSGSVWDIIDFQCKCDLLTLDNALED